MTDKMARVLLLDDYLDVMVAYEQWFRLEGWLPVTAATEPEALQALATWRPAVVVVEPYLSSGDGVAVARAARALLGPDVRLVAFSGRSGDELDGDDRALFDSYLIKPVPEKVFREAVGMQASEIQMLRGRR